MLSERLQIQTPGRGLVEITDELQRAVGRAGMREGLLHVFIRHTSASLIICENADPAVQRDLETWMSDLVRDGDPRFVHTAEGPDDMSAHVRSVLTASALGLPVADARLALGTWQGVFVWEHRYRPQTRQLQLTLLTAA